jgi:hypothetical protein
MIDNLPDALEQSRNEGDTLLDPIVSQLAADQGIAFLRSLAQNITSNPHFNFDNAPNSIQAGFNKYLALSKSPNLKVVSRACDFYQENKSSIGLILATYSLPYCYLGAKGVQVLYLSERIRNNTFERLMETGRFLADVNTYSYWKTGEIYTITFKIRLLHAIMRYFVAESGQWNYTWGVPICQEDMAGTNLSFSFLVIEGMQKMGQEAPSHWVQAYMEHWATIGELIGVDPAFCPNTWSDGFTLNQTIARRQFAPSPEAQALSKALVDVFFTKASTPLEANVLLSYMELFLGQEYANYLKIPAPSKEGSLARNLANVVGSLQQFF